MSHASTLITCHANADFDAFAAMLAARRLYTSAVLLFPGTQERGLQKIFSGLDAAAFGFVESDAVPWDTVDTLVLVDTRQQGRVSHVAPLLLRADVRIEMWDHHPDSPDDIAAAKTYWAQTGAVTTLLVEHLKKFRKKLTSEEATLLGLGIYGDTGSFTYSSTTPRDFHAAAWLLARGMDITRITEMAAHELTSLHIQAMNSLLESAENYPVNGVHVVLAETSLEHYLGDFAYLAHKIMEMESFAVLFAIGRMADRIQVVARSRSDAVNVGSICAALGGGGHTYAASASVRSMTMHEVRETILRHLYAQALPDKTAREYMSSPAVGMESSGSIREADELMLHFGLKAVPIFKPGTKICAGILDAQTAARANAHGLGQSRVEDYMTRRVHTLAPQATLKDLTAVIVGAGQRLVPIVENANVTGVVTRTDLIQVFAHETRHLEEEKNTGVKERNVGKLIQDRLPAESRRLLHLAGRLGAKLQLPVYAVGGFVRDLLLNRPNQDIDLVVEGNGIRLAHALAQELHGRVREHKKFLTSVVIFPDGKGSEARIDVATARLEYYEHPAALPTVELSSLKMDLFRRDFSINALAIRLDCAPFGQLIDFFGGQRDIKDRSVRVLHTLSFVEDPTRCLRAVRFEQRYNFRIGGNTEKLIKNALALNLVEKLSETRLFNEFRHICDESESAVCIQRLDQLGILQAISPQLALTPHKKNLLTRIQEVISWYRLLYFERKAHAWLVYFLGLTHEQTYTEATTHYRRLGLPEADRADILAQREHIRSVRGKLETWQKNAAKARTSTLCDLLQRLSLEPLLYLMASTPDTLLQKNISRYLTQWQHEKPDISGADLKKMGLPPGPEYGKILKVLREAKLDGLAVGTEEQTALAQGLIDKALHEKNRTTPMNSGPSSA